MKDNNDWGTTEISTESGGTGLTSAAVVSLYVVKNANDTYFAGFDAAARKANFVTDPILAKKFTNKYDIKLRPNETLVELSVDLSRADVKISEPFRPHRRVSKLDPKAEVGRTPT